MTEETDSAERAVDVDRPDVLERLDEANEALAALRDVLLVGEQLDDALQRLAETAGQAIADADAVTVSVVAPEQAQTAAATDHRLVDIDEKQYAANRGPCLEAGRSLRAVRAAVGENRETWPEFEAAAESHGIRAYLSVPLVLPATGGRQATHLGSLNIYSHTASAFDPFDEGLMRLFTTAACTMIVNHEQRQRSRDHIEHLEKALASRAVIDQAKGVLMAVHSCTAEEAFEMLVQRSQRANVKLRDIAKDLLDTVAEK